MPAKGTLEAEVCRASPEIAPSSCRLCRFTVSTEKEFRLHFELDHKNPASSGQMGCSACGRVFFGPGSKIDVIGHLKTAHEPGMSSPVVCPNASTNMYGELNATEDAAHSSCSGCLARFTSPRLRQSHLEAASSFVSDVAFGWACPLTEWPSEVADALGGPEEGAAIARALDTDLDVLRTELAAERAHQLVLAYCCPNCARMFVGESATQR
ncbi:unnamed protein product [Protopolystoma xenopodis]|uniref:Uncharacterized protein n=1 Tax=Protopolystoma xenopodis TaxID=117903 RepID=A0A448X4Q8_9PLAT|nr:unnamed protein product [Protopolystoma xenopodis]